MLMGRQLTQKASSPASPSGTHTYRLVLLLEGPSAAPYLNSNPVLISAFKPSLNSQTGLGRCEDRPHFAGRMLILVLSM